MRVSGVAHVARLFLYLHPQTVVRDTYLRQSHPPLLVGFVHTHAECADLRIILKLFWDRLLDVYRSQADTPRANRLYLSIAFTVYICF